MPKTKHRLNNCILAQRVKNVKLKVEDAKLKEHELILLHSINKNKRIEESLYATEILMCLEKSNNQNIDGQKITEKCMWGKQASLLRMNCKDLTAKVQTELNNLQKKKFLNHIKLINGEAWIATWKNIIKRQKNLAKIGIDEISIEDLIGVKNAKVLPYGVFYGS